MTLNSLTTQLLAEAIKNALDESTSKILNIKYKDLDEIPGLSGQLMTLGFTINTSDNRSHKTILISAEKPILQPNVFLYVHIQPVSPFENYSTAAALKHAEQLRSRLAFFEYVGKPDIPKKNIAYALLAAIVVTGRFTSKIHVAIYNPQLSPLTSYSPQSTLPSRLRRIGGKGINVVRYRFGLLKGRLTHYPVIGDLYIRWVLRKVLRNIDDRLPIDTASPRSIAVAMTWLDSGGVERVMLNLIKDLRLKGYRVHIITTVEGKHPWDPLFEEVSESVVHLPEMLGAYKYTSVAEHVFAYWLRKIQSPTLLITNSLTAYQALPIVFQKSDNDTKVFDILHTYGTPADDDAFLKKSMPFVKYIHRRVVIDELLKNYYTANYPVAPDSIEVIYNGLDDEVRNKTFSVQKESHQDHAVHIVYMGRLDPDKSPLRLVEIARHLRDTKQHAILDVYGDGSLSRALTDLAAKYKLDEQHIRFHGRSDKALIDIARADLNILVSDNEGIPMSILEAMHVGTPCIAPAVGGIPEMIDNDVDGFLFTYTSPDEESRLQSIFEAVDKACSAVQTEQIHTISKAARNKVVTKFGGMADQYDELIQSLHNKV